MPSTIPAISPFRLLRPYRKEDIRYYFGRDKETRQLYDALMRSKFMMVYGASGTGKTSLIQCGLQSMYSPRDWMPVLVRRSSDFLTPIREELYRRYRPAVVRRLTHLLGPESSVDDLCQETFVAAWRQLHRFRGEAPFEHWLLRIATNQARGHYRSQRRRPWRLWERREQDVEQQRHGVEPAYLELQAVHRALGELSTRLREAVVLFELEGLSLAELASTLDVSINTAASRVRRGRDKLREALTRLGYQANVAPSAEFCRGEVP